MTKIVRERISVTLDEAQVTWIRQRAVDRNTTPSEIIAEAVQAAEEAEAIRLRGNPPYGGDEL